MTITIAAQGNRFVVFLLNTHYQAKDVHRAVDGRCQFGT